MKVQAILNTGQTTPTEDVLKVVYQARKNGLSRHQRRVAAGKTKSKPYKGGSITSNNYKQLN